MMNPSQPNFASTHQTNQVNPMNGFTGFPIFPQGHPVAYGIPSGAQFPFMGLGSTGTPLLAPAFQAYPGSDPSLINARPFHVQSQKEKMNHALQFLNTVKNAFSDQPYSYSQFLDIMKEFKNQRIDTNSVIEKVKILFNGYPELIEGFNEFLPIPMQIHPYTENKKDYVNINYPAKVQQQPQQLVSPEQSEDEGKKSEFDHARAYVKKIKQRFSNQPHIYKTFLDILHKFSKDQQSLASVYEGVSALFKDHKDLLQEFKHFLPESSVNNYEEKTTSHRKTRSVKPKNNDIYMEEEQSKQYSEESLGRMGSYGTYEELEYFFKIKQSLSKEYYEDFLKVLMLFNNNAITIVDLYYLVKDILRDVDDHIIKWIKNFLQVEDLVDDSDEPGGYLADFDWSRSEKLGPSYRSTPLKWRSWKCSGRINEPICAEVLNDSWISVPTGSEDGTFEYSRKNQYEEILFKCEDDRYELDLVIERNLSAIRYLETVYSDLIELPYEESSKFTLNKSDLNILHINAIKNVYDYKGDEIINLLVSNPLGSIPIILERLKQKDIEWRESRNEWSKVWSLIFKNNHSKSLDHMSVEFKHEEKKLLNPKSLIAELRKKESGRSSKQKSVTKNQESILTLDIKDKSMVEHIKHLIYLTFENVFQNIEIEELDEFFNSFLYKFICFDEIKQISKDETFYCKPMTMPQEIVFENLKYLFIGTDTFYLMIRYYAFLYSRLNEAWDLCSHSKPISYIPDPIQNMYKIIKEAKKNVQLEENMEDTSEDDPQYQSKRFEIFLRNVRKLISNEIDQSTFEDKCRNMFGSKSYKLFTIDRILILLSKQISNIITDDTSLKLIDLYLDELSKSSRPSYYIYLSHCKEVIPEKKVFVLTYVPKTHQLGIRYVDISYLLNHAENEFLSSNYINNLVNNDREISLHSKPPPFLNRNLKYKNRIVEDNVDVLYNLGFKVMSDNNKIRYLEDTEDFFHRKKKEKNK